MEHSIPILLEIAQKMNTSTEFSKLLTSIVEIAKEYMGVKRVSVFLIESDKLYLKAFAGFNPDSIVVRAIGEGVVGTVAESGTTYVVNHQQTSEETGYSATSYLSVPIKLKNKIIGVLNLTDKFDDYFDENDVKMSEYIATQCALAVERYNLYEDMRGAERLQAIGVYRASVAHDIKNLLGIVEVYLSILEDTTDPEEIKDYIYAIREEVSRVQGIAQDIMEFSKKRIELRRSKFDLNRLCSDVCRHLNLSLIFTDIKVEIRTKGEMEICADKQKLFRILFNLANNSIQAIPEGHEGVVIIKTTDMGDKVAVSISDNGVGMTPEVVKTIFDPFVTTGKQKGTGLGLAIVKEVVSAHAGNIRVRSTPDKCTIFRVVIPKNGDCYDY